MSEMKEVFNDDQGKGSSMNFVWLLSLITIIGVWIFLSIKTGSLQHVTGGDALWFTSLFSGKIVQNFYENKNPLPATVVKHGILQNKNGKFSPSRLVWILAVLGIIFTWAFLSWKNTAMQHFSTGDAAWFTALFGSKVGHSIIERSSYGDYDESEGFEYNSKDISSSSNIDGKDTLIKQLQETVKVQSEFNKNLVETITPKKDKDND